MARPDWFIVPFLLIAILLASATFFAPPKSASANHDGEAGELEARAIGLVVDGEPTLARVHEPNVPDDCWTIQEFPYKRTSYLERKEECVDPWISVHQMFTFEVNAGGTYVLWNELLAPSMPAQFFPPITEVFVEATGENRWLGFQSPLVDVQNQTYGHVQSSRWVEDLSVLRRWGWDDDLHIDHRTPTEEGIRNRIAYAFTATEDGKWRFSAGGTNPLPPGTYDEGDNIRVWVQRLDGAPESTVFPTERFDYPPVGELVIEHGATVFREFVLTERHTAEPATGVSVNLSPTGTCSSLDPGQMRCTIQTTDLPQGSQQFRFTSATHNDQPESVIDWPTFGFTTIARDIKTRAEMTLDGKAKGQIVAGIYVTGESGLGIEFHDDGSLTLDSGEAVALGISTDVGFGAGLKLGWISPRAKGEIEFEADVKAFESVVIKITDTGDFNQQVALSAFLFDKLVSLGTIATSLPLDAVLNSFREDVLQEQFKPFVKADEVGVAVNAHLTGKLGSWTGNRPGLGQFNFGLGSTAGGAISTSWKFDKKTGDHAIVVQIAARAAGVFNPTLWPLYFEGQEIAYSVTGGANVEVTFGFDGNPFTGSGKMRTVTVEVKGGTTWDERIDSGSISFTFDAEEFRNASTLVLENLIDLTDPANVTEFSAEVLSNLFQAALEDVDGELVIKRSRGTGFKPAFELGAELLAGVGVSGEVEVGGDWRLVVTEKTQDWRLLVDVDGKRGLVQIAEFPFEETEASETQFSDIVGRLILESLQQHLPGASFREWITEQWTSGEELTIDASSEQTETALLDFSDEDRTVMNRLGGEVTALEIAVRTWFNQILPDWIVPGGKLETPFETKNIQIGFNPEKARQSTQPSFFASEFMDVGPAGTTVDPSFEINLSYLTDPPDPQQLKMYRYAGENIWLPLLTEIDATAKVATAQVFEFGTFVVGYDTNAPQIFPVQTTTGFTAVVGDSGSGVDPESISLTVDGELADIIYDSTTQTVMSTEPIGNGAEILLVISDPAGNEATLEHTVNELTEDNGSNSASAGAGNGSAQSTATPEVIFGRGGVDEESSGGGISPVMTILIGFVIVIAAAGVGFYFSRKQRRVKRTGQSVE